MKKTLFLILSGAIVIFSIICICSAPIINRVIPSSDYWKTINCQKLTDDYKEAKKGNDKDTIETAKRTKNRCNRYKAMYGLEYSSLIIDVICGFICTILGLLHFFDIGKPFEKAVKEIDLALSHPAVSIKIKLIFFPLLNFKYLEYFLIPVVDNDTLPNLPVKYLSINVVFPA